MLNRIQFPYIGLRSKASDDSDRTNNKHSKMFN
jgi:hypothetical protein